MQAFTLRSLLSRFRRGLRAKRRFLICDEMLPNPKMGAGYPRARKMLSVLAETGSEIMFIPVLGAPTCGLAATAQNQVPTKVQIADASYRGRDGVKRLLREKPGHFTDFVISRPTTMRELRPLIDEAPSFLRGVSVTYDAEAIFALREIQEEELAGNSLSSAERQRRISAEVDLCRGVQRVISVSEHEADIFRRHGYPASLVGHATVVTESDVSFQQWEVRRDFLFVGAIHGDSGPNYESVIWFLDKIWPELVQRFPDSRCIIAGLNHSKRLTEEPLPERVTVTGELEDLIPVYAGARVFVAPTRASAGIPLKVIEAAGQGVPVVAASHLVDQLNWRSPAEIIAATNAEEFVDFCTRLFDDRLLWEDQRRAALQRVSEEYSEAAFSKQLFKALNMRGAGHSKGTHSQSISNN